MHKKLSILKKSCTYSTNRFFLRRYETINYFNFNENISPLILSSVYFWQERSSLFFFFLFFKKSVSPYNWKRAFEYHSLGEEQYQKKGKNIPYSVIMAMLTNQITFSQNSLKNFLYPNWNLIIVDGNWKLFMIWNLSLICVDDIISTEGFVNINKAQHLLISHIFNVNQIYTLIDVLNVKDK